MDARNDRLGAFAAEAQPAWTAAAGPVPADPAQRAEWERRVSHVGAYRELYGWDHPTEPVGPEPSGDTPEKRAAWHAAYGAMTRIEGIDLRDRSDGSLHLMRDTYRAETEWAPPHVAEELRAVRHGRTDMAARANVEAEAARKAGDNELAAQHEQIAAGARWADAFYAQIEDMDAEIMTQREEWARVTEGSRHLAVLADAELRRRHPGAPLDPLRSAEPDEPTLALPDPAEPDPQLTGRLEAHKETTAQFRARLEERQGVQIPNQDPDYQYEGEAWPSPWQPWDRDAVLKPPQPEIQPAPQVERLAAARDIELEAGL
jgi:hypothetical protein